MTQQEIVDFMVNSVNQDNRLFAKQAGLSEAQIEESIIQSQQTIQIMMQNICGKLIQLGVIQVPR
jgi:hypothetical protein